MLNEEFIKILEARITKTTDVLANKAKEYATDEDRLHNFKRAAAMLDTTPEKALVGMWSKHVVSILDMVEHPHTITKEKIDEKIGDAINYLVLLEGILLEQLKMEEPADEAIKAIKEVLHKRRGRSSSK